MNYMVLYPIISKNTLKVRLLFFPLLHSYLTHIAKIRHKTTYFTWNKFVPSNNNISHCALVCMMTVSFKVYVENARNRAVIATVLQFPPLLIRNLLSVTLYRLDTVDYLLHLFFYLLISYCQFLPIQWLKASNFICFRQ